MALNPLQQFFSKVGARDVQGALAVIDDATVFEPQGPAYLPIYGRFVGKAGVERLLGTLAEQFETETFESRKWAEADEYGFADERCFDGFRGARITDDAEMHRAARGCGTNDVVDRARREVGSDGP